MSTKIHTLVDALGNPTGFHLTGGEAHDLAGADHLLPDIHAAGKTSVIPSKANRKSQREYDRHLYKERHLIETFFAKLKQFRAIATRYDKTARNFLAAVYLAASAIWLN